MNQQPDKLFREKLEGYQRPLPAGAWDKLEAGLGKKNNYGLWLKVAASLLLIAVAAYLWPTDVIQPQPVATQKPVGNKIVAPDKTDTNTVIEKSITPVFQEKETANVVNRNTVNKTYPSTEKIIAPEVTVAELEQTEVVPEIKETVAQIQIDIPLTETPVVAVTKELTPEDNSITLIYSAEEVNEKYLDKNALAQATSEEKKSSTFKKLLNKAYALKHDQDPFGELRQKKNEILALNFKKKNNVGKTSKTL